MAVLDTLITDRTQEDVLAARAVLSKLWSTMTQAERAACQSGLKGAYGPSDMNRIRTTLEEIDRLMVQAKRESVYEAVPISHAEYNGSSWRRWTDTACAASDYVGPGIYLDSINRLWEAARRFEAEALERYDPGGSGYIHPGTVVDAGMMFTVTDSVGLLELRVTAVCPPDVTAQGAAWTVTPSKTGWTAALDYPAGPYPFLKDALEALKITSLKDGIVNAAFTLSATLRYDHAVTAGTCAVCWSSVIKWNEARALYTAWDGAQGLTWDMAARGIKRVWQPYAPAGSSAYITPDGREYSVWRYENGIQGAV